MRVPPSGLNPYAAAIASSRVDFPLPFSPAKKVTGFENGGMRIACRGGFVDILELQMEGKNRMTADVFANGAGRSLIGKQFE